MGMEYEWKFRATEQMLDELYRQFGASAKCIRMETTYYDTPSASLSARRYTLRRRMENESSVCTLKTPGDGMGRREWEVPCGSIQEAIHVLCKLSKLSQLETLVQEGLVPICGARFTRHAILLEQAGTVIELALDHGVLTGNDREVPLCEVELEFKSGSLNDAAAFASRFAEKYRLTPEPQSKFSRALHLSKGE